MPQSKILYIVRHAKSSWADMELDDFDRPLNRRGLINAPEMGHRIARLPNIPNKIITSPAKRAMETATAMAKSIGISQGQIYPNSQIYEASFLSLITIIKQFKDDDQCLILVGHNPGFTHLVNDLANENIENIPTCGVAVLKFNIERWQDISVGSATLIRYDYPKKKDTY